MTVREAPSRVRREEPPPHDVQAEESLLGAMLLSADAVEAGLEGCTGADFYKPIHGHVFAAMRALHTAGTPVDPVTVAGQLRRQGLLETVGGGDELISLQAAAPATSNARHYARIVADNATARRLAVAGTEVADLAFRGLDVAEMLSAAESKLQEVVSSSPRRQKRLAHPGGAFILDGPADVSALWGADDEVLWASGESLMIVGPAGVGKTTLAQQVTLAVIGLRREVLGLPVASVAERVLYVAADRPAQARRSMRRMVTEEDREILDERLHFWSGPPPVDVSNDSGALLRLARDHGADVLVLDSLKDIAAGLSDDLVGSRVNIALQTALAAGLEVLVLHHQRKEQRGAGKPKALSDVYGSTWLVNGAGSVVLLWGDPGDAYVELSHLKQPAGVVGPLQVLHDHFAGSSSVEEQPTAWSVLQSAGNGISAPGLALILSDSTEPAATGRARRALENLVKRGKAHKVDGRRGGDGGADAALYFPLTSRPDEG